MPPVVCEDCGFVLSEGHEDLAPKLEGCLFCGNTAFYMESGLVLGKRLVCYLCGAEYPAEMVQARVDDTFSRATFRAIMASDAARSWTKSVCEAGGDPELVWKTKGSL
jgi:hypothetical protein